jgi:hypothetical protein
MPYPSSPSTFRQEVARLTDLTAAASPDCQGLLRLLSASQRAALARHVLLILPIRPWLVTPTEPAATVEGLAAAVVERWCGQSDALVVANTWADPWWLSQRRASDAADVRSLAIVPVGPTAACCSLMTFAFDSILATSTRLPAIIEAIAPLITDLLTRMMATVVAEPAPRPFVMTSGQP